MTVAWRTSSPSTMASCALRPSRSRALPPLAHRPRSEPTCWQYKLQVCQAAQCQSRTQTARRLCDSKQSVADHMLFLIEMTCCDT
jgi:hypothetical protein